MGVSIRLLLLLAFCCILRCMNADDAKQQQQQLRSAMVVGTVYCDTCFQNQFSKASHFISGASVSVECGDGMAKNSFRKEVKTNRHGVFRIRLPPKVSRNINNIKSCSVKLIKSNEPFCAVASSSTSTGLHLKSKRNGLHLFSAGFFTFKPLKKPGLCYQEPKPESFAEQKPAQPAFFFFPPPIPFLPSPPVLPPNPLVPPPSLLPPVIPSPPPSILPPFFPSPPPSVLPPFFPSPPPSFLPPFPNLPLPLLTPPPPPPASLFPPFPFPFPPNPLFPGNPPAAPHPAETPP